MNKTAILAVIPLMLSGSAAFSAATEDGAAHLTEVFQTYLGTVEGVVSVEVDGEDYTLTLDAAPFAALAAEAGGTMTMTPFVMTLTDNEDGTWDVTQDQALSFSVIAPGAAEIKLDIASFTSDGVFDEELMSFASSSSEFSGVALTEKITDAQTGEMNIDMSLASGSYESTSVAGAAGGVDSTFTMAMTGLVENFTTPAQDGMPPMPIAVTAESMTQTGKIDGLRPDAFYQVLAWFVANPNEAAIMTNKAGLKSIIEAGVPFFTTLSSTSAIKTMAVTTPMGNVGMAEFGIGIDLNGLVADGKLREAISVKGLTLPEALIPAWAVPILPKDVSIDFQVTDYDAAGAAKVALGLFDLPVGAEPDAAFDAAMMAALLPKSTVTIGLNPGSVSGDGYALTFEGSMVAGPEMEVPTGKATITLTGLDKLQAAIAAAPEDIKGQAMMGVGMAQGMAKPGPNGELIWEIDASTPGSLSVNGTPLMGGN